MKTFYRIAPQNWLFLTNATIRSIQKKALEQPDIEYEEYVRQWVIQELINTYKYPIDRIQVEYSVRIGSDTKFADIVIFNNSNKPYIYIETKALNKNDDLRQVKSYVAAEITCIFGVWTNGNSTQFFQKILDPNELVVVNDLPRFGKTSKSAILTLSPAKDFIQVLKNCHNILRSEESYHPDEAFDEMSKLLYAKIYDEFNPDPKLGYKFQRALYSNETELKSSIISIYEEAKISEENLFTDSLKLKSSTLFNITKELEDISISETALDIKGMAFESFLGTTFRGQLGQYFTPRQVVEFMVEFVNPNESDKILDTACGSGGFLLYALNYVRNSIDSQQKIHDIALRKKIEFSMKNIYGIEISPRLSRIAMMNMIMNEDGHSNIRNEDALLAIDHYSSKAPRLEKESFTIILTNPPFGSKSTVYSQEIVSNFALGSKNSQRKSQKKDILFIERNLEFLKEGGILGIVLPDGILGNPSLEYVRKFILAHSQILAVISISEDTFKPSGAGVKSSLIFLKKTGENSLKSYNIFMAEVDNIGFDATGRPNKNELPLVLHAYQNEEEQWSNFQKNHCRWIHINEVENVRFEAYYYNPIHQEITHKLNEIQKNNKDFSVLPLKSLGRFIHKMSKKEIEKYFEVNESVKYIEIGNIDIKLGEIHGILEYTHEEIPNNAQKMLKEGDIVISTRRPTRGAIAVIDKSCNNALCTTFLEVFRPNTGSLSEYIKFALRSEFSKLQFKKYSTFTSYPVISKNDIGNILIPIPQSMEKQRKIIEKALNISLQINDLQNKIQEKYVDLEQSILDSMYLQEI